MKGRGIRTSGVRRLRGTVACFVIAAAAFWISPAPADPSAILTASQLGTTDGRQVYERICQGCHMPDARGAIGAGRYPALAKNPSLVSRQYMALTILVGRRNMPAFGAKNAITTFGPSVTLNEAQIAAVINYVRSHFGNSYRDTITSAEVASLYRSVP